MRKPLCIDLFCGLGGWSEGFLAEGWEVIGFDIERHRYPIPEMNGADGHKGTKPYEKRGWTQGCALALGLEGAEARPRTRMAEYPAQLVLQDVLTLDGRQFRNADCIVASPPCQEFSYMAMPWSRAKQIAAALRGEDEFPEGYTGSSAIADLRKLFDACFRIQREACEAAGRYIPMVVENVKGAQPWVGPAKANFGSFYLWGDVGMVGRKVVAGRLQVGDFAKAIARGAQKHNPDGTDHPQGSWFAVTDSKERGGRKVEAFNFHQHEQTGRPGGSFQSAAVKTAGHVNIRDVYSHTRHLTNQAESDAIKQHGSGPGWFDTGIASCSSKSSARKAASAQIAKIPFALSSYLARVFRPSSLR